MVRIINRLASMWLDHFVMLTILTPIWFGFLFALQLIFYSSYPDIVPQNNHISYAILLLPVIIYLLKDSYRGKSIVKRVIGLQVIDRASGNPASVMQCFIRNLTLPLFPLEVIISVFSPSIRLGDLIAGTRVITANKEPVKTILKDMKSTRVSYNSFLILSIGIAYCYLLAYLLVKLDYA